MPPPRSTCPTVSVADQTSWSADAVGGVRNGANGPSIRATASSVSSQARGDSSARFMPALPRRCEGEGREEVLERKSGGGGGLEIAALTRRPMLLLLSLFLNMAALSPSLCSAGPGRAIRPSVPGGEVVSPNDLPGCPGGLYALPVSNRARWAFIPYTGTRVTQVITALKNAFDYVGFAMARFTNGARSGGSAKDVPRRRRRTRRLHYPGFQAGWRCVY